MSDVELLTQFLKLKNESAFAALVDRYGQMVFAVSLRIVRDRHSAEDVTQATFLLLAKDAKKIERSLRFPGLRIQPEISERNLAPFALFC